MTKPKPRISRRTFLAGTTAAVLAYPLLQHARARNLFPNARLQHACVGVGGMGGYDLQQFAGHPGVQITALCDVDANALKKAAKAFPGARTYTDWRELLEQEGDRIDSVSVSVPDHNHFAVAMQAMQAGKHVYCQKPMCHDVAEVRALTEASIRYGMVTQLGTQHASGTGDRTAVELIRKGVIGKVRQVYLCSNRPGAVDAYRLVGPRPGTGQPPPPHLDWDLWLGTAPERPYNPEIYHPAKWRAWQDFGTGWSGDIGCHILDAVWKGLELQAPLTVTAEVQDSWAQNAARRADTWPQGDHITWVFPGNALTEQDTLQVEWFDGDFYPPEDIRALYPGDYPAEAAMLVGTEGALLIPHTKMPVLLPQEQFADVRFPAPKERNHYHHFLDACLGKTKTKSHFARSGPMTETILLGTIAIRVPGEVLEWDAENMRFPGNREARQCLKRKYRKGWRKYGV